MSNVKTKPETVEVIITAVETLRHRQRVKIPKAVYDRYEAMVEAGTYRGRDFDDAFGDYLHPDTDASSDGVEDVEMTLAKPQ